MKKFFTASALVSCAASHALAGPCDGVYRYGVPDFDQKRSGLLNDGSMHCVPTSALNWMAYARNHGLANTMGHASSNWASASEYSHVTTRLDKMGDLMLTDGGGTNMSEACQGLRDYFDFYNVPAFFVFSGFVADEDWTPTPATMRYYLAHGALVNMCFGRYDLEDGHWARHGGHSMSLVRVSQPCSSNPVIGYKNPSTGDSILTQSAFETGTWTLESHLRNVGGDVRTVWEPTGQTGTEGRRFIDKLLIMHPFFGWTAPATGQGFVLAYPWQLNNAALEPATLPSPSGTPVSGFAVSARDPGFFASTRTGRFHPSELWFYSQVDERFRLIASLPSGEFGPLTTTRQGDLVALGDGSVRKYRLAGDGSVRLLQQANIPYVTSAIAVDDATDDLFVLASDRRRLLRYTDANLLLPASDYPLPTSIILGGDCSMSVDPVDGRLWITSEGSGAAFEISRAATHDGITHSSTVPLTPYPNPRSLRFDDRGIMRFISGGLVRALKQDPASGRYLPDPTAPLADTPASGFLDIPTSRNNHNPAKHDVPGWNDTPQPRDLDELPDCPADFNGDNQVDFFDYLDFVAALDSENYDADVNFDLTLDFFDYLDFVAWYSRGC